jgi:hypothetical protein
MCGISLCTRGALDTWSRGRSTAALGVMKAQVLRAISGSAIVKRAPPPLKAEVSTRRFEREDALFTLLVFPSQRQDVVQSGAVSHVLGDVPKDARLVAFGGCFTLEALALLRARNVDIFAQSDFPWTDERWQNRGKVPQ